MVVTLKKPHGEVQARTRIGRNACPTLACTDNPDTQTLTTFIHKHNK